MGKDTENAMKNLDFSFIDNKILRENIEYLANDISVLMIITELQENVRIGGFLRKNIIIYTASIVEALLLWKIDMESKSEKITLLDVWNYYDIIPIYMCENFDIISGKRNRKKRDISKLDFNRMIQVCKEQKILGENLIKRLDRVRRIRNKLHISGTETIRKSYSQSDINFVFEVLDETIQSVR